MPGLMSRSQNLKQRQFTTARRAKSRGVLENADELPTYETTLANMSISYDGYGCLLIPHTHPKNKAKGKSLENAPSSVHLRIMGQVVSISDISHAMFGMFDQDSTTYEKFCPTGC